MKVSKDEVVTAHNIVLIACVIIMIPTLIFQIAGLTEISFCFKCVVIALSIALIILDVVLKDFLSVFMHFAWLVLLTGNTILTFF